MAHILVIDDEAALRKVISLALTGRGDRVSQAENGRVAIQLLRSGTFDLVITDLLMPEQDGIETIIALRQNLPPTPVIAMSGAPNNSALYLEIAQRLGVRRTLAKPFDISELITAVDEVLERVCPA